MIIIKIMMIMIIIIMMKIKTMIVMLIIIMTMIITMMVIIIKMVMIIMMMIIIIMITKSVITIIKWLSFTMKIMIYDSRWWWKWWFHKDTQLKYFWNIFWNTFNCDFSDPTMSQFCTCQDSSVVVTYAKVWADLINILHVWATCVSTRFRLLANDECAKSVSWYPVSPDKPCW